MTMKRLTMMMALALGLAAAGSADAQVMLQSAVVSSGGGHATATGSTTMIDYTIGQPVVGRASNGTVNGDFGFWTPSVAAGPSSVDFEFPTGAVSMARIAPNPARDRAKLDLVLTQRGRVDVVLYDANGRAVATLYSGERSAGAFELPMDLTGIASGAYHVAISVPGALVQRPLTVVR